MDDKTTIVAMLREEFKRWEELLAGMSEAQLTDPQLPSNWSIKDVIAHLWPWQQRSIARMEAALHPLSFILLASYEHHHVDHLEPLLARLRQDGNT
jgi:hypothetical protein